MCVEVECAATRVTLDAGTGLRALGAHLNRARERRSARTSCSATCTSTTSWACPRSRRSGARTRASLLHVAKECLMRSRRAFSVLRPPLFPVEAGTLPAADWPQDVRAWAAPSLRARRHRAHASRSSHQGPCAGSSSSNGRGANSATSPTTSTATRKPTSAWPLAVEGADLLIYDATFTDAEMAGHRGWGHSTWEEGLRLKQRAGVKPLGAGPSRTRPLRRGPGHSGGAGRGAGLPTSFSPGRGCPCVFDALCA